MLTPRHTHRPVMRQLRRALALLENEISTVAGFCQRLVWKNRPPQPRSWIWVWWIPMGMVPMGASLDRAPPQLKARLSPDNWKQSVNLWNTFIRKTVCPRLLLAAVRRRCKTFHREGVHLLVMSWTLETQQLRDFGSKSINTITTNGV